MYNIALIYFLSLSCSSCASHCVIAMMPKWLDILTRPGQANNCCSVFNFHSLKYLGLFVLFQCATYMFLLLSVFLNCCNSISHTISQLYFSAEKYLRLFVLCELPHTLCVFNCISHLYFSTAFLTCTSQLYFSAEKYLRLFVLYELPPTVCFQLYFLPLLLNRISQMYLSTVFLS